MSRSSFPAAWSCAAALLVGLPAGAEAPKTCRVYVGTYTGGQGEKASKGVYRFDLDLATGKAGPVTLAGEAVSPSFLALHPSGRFLYAVAEIENFEGKKKTGGVLAFAIDPKTGDLTRLNAQSSGGGGPCHLVVDKAGKQVLAANYGGGSACLMPVGEDGKLGEASDVVQHKGSSVNPARQKEPHAHSVNLDAANRFAFVADLGLDKVMVYKVDDGKLKANDPPAFDITPGAGPRHFAFHPSGKYAYVINELANTVTAAGYDADKGVLTKLHEITTLPADFKGQSYTAEVVVHPSGKFLYGSNRGHNSIAVFKVGDDGKLTPAGHQGTGIKTPRNFNLDPTGRWLLVGNQDGDSIAIFRVDQETGALEPAGTVAVPRPMCIKFLPLR